VHGHLEHEGRGGGLGGGGVPGVAAALLAHDQTAGWGGVAAAGWWTGGGGLVATSRAETDWLCELPALQWRLTDGGREGDGVCRIL
jgi:hypothetical protein